MSIENEVREASEKFYAALNRMVNGDAGLLAFKPQNFGNVPMVSPAGAFSID